MSRSRIHPPWMIQMGRLCRCSGHSIPDGQPWRRATRTGSSVSTFSTSGNSADASGQCIGLRLRHASVVGGDLNVGIAGGDGLGSKVIARVGDAVFQVHLFRLWTIGDPRSGTGLFAAIQNFRLPVDWHMSVLAKSLPTVAARQYTEPRP